MHKCQYLPHKTAFALAAAILACCLNTPAAGAQGPAAKVQILGVDAGAFPDILVRMILRDSHGGGAGGVTAGGLSIAENSIPVVFDLAEEEGGVELAFILDGGMGLYADGASGDTRLEEMKRVVVEVITGSQWKAGQDRIHVIVQEPGGMLILADEETPIARIPAILAGYQPDTPQQLARPLDAVVSFLDRFADETQAGDMNARAMIVLTGILQAGPSAGVQTVSEKASALGIPIHTVLVRSGFELGDNLQWLSRKTGGLFSHFGLAGTESIAELNAVLGSLRRQYVAAFRSKTGQSGIQLVSVELSRNPAAKPAVAQYEAALEPPAPVILSPENGKSTGLQRAPAGDPAAARDTASGWDSGGKPGLPVKVAVSWPDGHPREIRRAVLVVNGKEQPAVDASGEELTLWWIPTAEETGAASPARIQVRLEDELGFTGESDPVSVRVVTGLAAVLAGVSAGSLVLLVAVVLALGAAAFLVVSRRQAGGETPAAAPSASTTVQNAGETMRFHTRIGAARAALIDVDRTCGWPQAAFELTGTVTIGRSGEGAALQLHPGRADSPISRLHCTIFEEDGVFYIRDEQSANGTSRNGIRLVPLERQPLADGDILQFANPQRGGVRLQFQFMHGIPKISESDFEATFRMDRP